MIRRLFSAWQTKRAYWRQQRMFDRQLRDARLRHAPTRQIEAARRAFVHACLSKENPAGWTAGLVGQSRPNR